MFRLLLVIFVSLLFLSNSKFISNRGKSKHNNKNHGKGPLKGIDDDDISIKDFKRKGNGIKKAGKSFEGKNVRKEKVNQYFQNIPIWGASIVIEYEENDENYEDGFVDFGVYYDKKNLRKYITNTKSKLNDNDIKEIIGNDLGNSYPDFTFDCNEWIYFVNDDDQSKTIPIPYFSLICYVHGEKGAGAGSGIIPSDDKDETVLYYQYILDALSGDILEKTNLLQSVWQSVSESKSGNDGNLNPSVITSQVTENTEYPYLKHNTYNIQVQDCSRSTNCVWLQCSSPTDCEAQSKDINGGYGIALLAYHYAVDTYKCFNELIGEDPVTLSILSVRVHYDMNYDNAFWDGLSITFGDGSYYYPHVSMDVMAHELGHGYTEQHSHLIDNYEAGAMNEAFSDLAGKACEEYSKGSYNWNIGEDISKTSGSALRYMNDPPKDGKSIDSYSNYYTGLDPHYSSGVYNKAFYNMVSNGLVISDVFKIASKANDLYWTPISTMHQGAEGMLFAAFDLGLSVAKVRSAFVSVGINVGLSDLESTHTAYDWDQWLSTSSSSYLFAVFIILILVINIGVFGYFNYGKNKGQYVPVTVKYMDSDSNSESEI